MKITERRIVRSICEHVLRVVDQDKGTVNKEVLQRSVVRLRALLRRGLLRKAEEVAYGILMDVRDLSSDSSDDEAVEDHETSKAPIRSVGYTVDIGRSIKFVRVAAGLRQGEMAKRLDISQNYLSLLENNRAEPSLSLLRRIASEFHVPMSFLFLEGTVEFESDEPEMHALLQELRNLIHNLQRSRIRDSQEALDGASPATR